MNDITLRKRIDAIPDAWVRLVRAESNRKGLCLLFEVRSGQRGKVVAGFSIRCSGVREHHIGELDGGGMRRYPSSHPAARQTFAPRARLAIEGKGDPLSALGALVTSHVSAVDDWVPVARYLGDLKTLVSRLARGPVVFSGPAFLLARYARAARRLGWRTRLTRLRQAKRRPATVLHFSESFVVAERFQVEAFS